MIREVPSKFLNTRSIFLYNSEGSRNRHVVNTLREKIILNSEEVLHLGAHEGQEASYYFELGLKVIWVEELPEKHKILLQNTSEFSNQKSILALLGSKEGLVKFNVSSNDGQSSSIYNFGDDVQFKDLNMVNHKLLTMKRLDSLLSEKIIVKYTRWVVDVQSAELEVLKGAGKLLDYCYSLQVEVTSRDPYRGGANAQEVINFLLLMYFINIQEYKIGYHEDLLFIRVRR